MLPCGSPYAQYADKETCRAPLNRKMEISAPTLRAVNNLGMWKPEPPPSQPGCEPQMSDLCGRIKNNRCSDGALQNTKEEPYAAINSPV